MEVKKYISFDKLTTYDSLIKSEIGQKIEENKTIVDDSLSSTSTNPVQNKVLDAEFEAISVAMNAMEMAIDDKAESWNDLADKPFYNENIIIDWDGNVDNKDTFAIVLSEDVYYNYYKLSDDVPAINDFVGGTVSFNGETLTLTSDFLIPDVGCYYLGEPAFVVIQNTNASMDGVIITPPSTGIYFMNMNGAYVSNLTYGSTKTLDEVFIPDTIARKSDIPEINSLELITTDDIDTICGQAI